MIQVSKEKISHGALKNVHSFLLQNEKGTALRLSNFGAAIWDIQTAGRSGKLESVVLGYASLDDYFNDSVYMGATVGRYCNRIKEGKFSIGDNAYELLVNNGPNHLHGGVLGFDKQVWDFEVKTGAVEFSLTSPDGDNGYPGNLEVRVKYTLTETNQVIIDFRAVSDQDTLVNLTNHSYFNLSGNCKASIREHELMIQAGEFTPMDENNIPTGEIRPVAGTPFDFRTFKKIGLDIDSNSEQLLRGAGYDHNFVLDHSESTLTAKVREPISGRTLTIFSTQPGLQFYSGNYLHSGLSNRTGTIVNNRDGFALESQFFPDSPNHPNFPSAVLKADEPYQHKTIFEFGTYTG